MRLNAQDISASPMVAKHITAEKNYPDSKRISKGLYEITFSKNEIEHAWLHRQRDTYGRLCYLMPTYWRVLYRVWR